MNLESVQKNILKIFKTSDIYKKRPFLSRNLKGKVEI
jgi:hypothetical protein